MNKYIHDIQTFPSDGLRAWRTGGWLALRKEIRRRTLGRLGGYVRRVLIETDLHRLGGAGLPPRGGIPPFYRPHWTPPGENGPSREPPQVGGAQGAGRRAPPA